MEIERKYGVTGDIYFPLIDFGATDFEDTPVTFAAGDVSISKDGGSLANTTNLPTHIGGGLYKLVLTATELTAKLVQILIRDVTATKLWEDQAVLIATFGNAAAQFAFDRSVANQDVAKVTGNVDGTVGSVVF